MDFSPQQADALEKIKVWHDKAVHGLAPQVFRMFGYAGTGKTTLAKAMKGFANKVQYAALTGKAALVLRGKGCEGATTIHSMIYRSLDKSSAERDQLKETLQQIEGIASRKDEADKLVREIQQMNRDLQQPSFHLNLHAFDREWSEEFEQFVSLTPPDLICIDECSMVDKRIGEDLESFHIPILVLGDPAQLPPIAGGGYFTGTKERPVRPDVLLTEIHRQAAGNPVLQIATQIREGGLPPEGVYGDSRIVNKLGLTQAEWLEADQILAGKNATRRSINNRCRQLRGFTGILPCVGERIVCLRNNHARGLLNGSMWRPTVVADAPDTPYFTMTLESLDSPDMEPVETVAHKKPFLGQEFDDANERKMADEFDFGHCITTHKAQGSEWPNVIYIDEWPGQGRKQHQYTGVTRASERITIVKW